MKNTILPVALLLVFAALAPAGAPPPKMWEVMFSAKPENPQRLTQLKELIRRGADVNAPLLFDRMLMEGEDPSSLKPTAWPLDVVIQQTRVDMVTLLLTNGAKLHGGELAKAALAGNQDQSPAMIAALLQAGADVNSRHESFSALFWASSKGHKESVKLLLAQPGIKLDGINVDGDTALMTAVEQSHAEIIEMLVKAGANVSITNKHGETAIALARKGLERQQARVAKQQAIISTLQSRPK